MSKKSYKVVVLGEGRVGKTSITLKYVKGEFNHKEEETVNASFLEKKSTTELGKTALLNIWDTAGQEKYHSIAPVYYREAHAALIVYDIASSQSFERAKKWVIQLNQHCGKEIIIMLVGNKSDLEKERKVNSAEVDNYCKKEKIKHFLVSAKNGSKINELFQALTEKLLVESGGVSVRNKNSSKVKIDFDKPEYKVKSKKCCS